MKYLPLTYVKCVFARGYTNCPQLLSRTKANECWSPPTTLAYNIVPLSVIQYLFNFDSDTHKYYSSTYVRDYRTSSTSLMTHT